MIKVEEVKKVFEEENGYSIRKYLPYLLKNGDMPEEAAKKDSGQDTIPRCLHPGDNVYVMSYPQADTSSAAFETSKTSSKPRSKRPLIM